MNTTWKYAEDSPELVAFLKELVELYKKYGVSISHEDSQGGFEIEKFNENNVDWIKSARDAR